jgi:hypothetical protein
VCFQPELQPFRKITTFTRAWRKMGCADAVQTARARHSHANPEGLVKISVPTLFPAISRRTMMGDGRLERARYFEAVVLRW